MDCLLALATFSSLFTTVRLLYYCTAAAVLFYCNRTTALSAWIWAGMLALHKHYQVEGRVLMVRGTAVMSPHGVNTSYVDIYMLQLCCAEVPVLVGAGIDIIQSSFIHNN